MRAGAGSAMASRPNLLADCRTTPVTERNLVRSTRAALVNLRTGFDYAPCTVPARARARSTSFCKSTSLHRPRLTGLRGLMSADRQ